MRLKADIWAKAHLRRAEASGAIAMVLRKGDPDAGAIYVKVVGPDRTCVLYGPAPEAEEGVRLWRRLGGGAPEAEIDARLQREIRIDPDLWALEIEDRLGRHFLDEHLAPD